MQHKQADRGFEVANEDGDKFGKKRRRDVIDRFMASRHMAWLKRGSKQEVVNLGDTGYSTGWQPIDGLVIWTNSYRCLEV